MKKIYMIVALFSCFVALAQVDENGKQILPPAKKPSDEAQLFFAKGEQLRSVKKYREAIDEYNRALAKDPTNAKIEFQKALCFLSLNDDDNAMVSLLKTVTLNSQHTEAFARLGALYQKKEKLSEAIFYYDKAFQTATSPKDKQDYKLNILQILARQNKFTEMGRHIEEAQSITSDNLMLMFYSGRYYNQVGEYESARNVMERATQLLKLKSNNPSEIAGYYYELGYAYYKLGLFREAKEALKYANFGNYRALVAEMSPDYLYAVATAYYDIFDYETTLALLDEVLKMDNKYAQAVELRVRVFSAQSDKESVIREMKTAVELEQLPMNKVPKLMEICRLEIGNKKYMDAYNTADACLALQPNNYLASFYKAVAFQKLDKAHDAIKELNNILSYTGIDAETKSKCYFLMGNIYRDKGDSKAADKSYKNVTQGNYRYAAAREQKKLKEQ